MKKLLSNLGFYEVWLQQNVGNVDIFLILAKQRLKDNLVKNGVKNFISRPELYFIDLKHCSLRPLIPTKTPDGIFC